jgi:site-specific DNA-methyltransferase (adenine-specific)
MIEDIHEYMNKRMTAEALLFISYLPDDCVDVVLTDPPYNYEWREKETIHNQFLRICRGTIIVFSPPKNQWILPADQYLFWIKPISTKNTSKSYSRFVEMIFVYGRHVWNSKRHWSQYTNVFTDLVDDSKIHPYRKPPSLIERLILNHTNKGDIILDPFAGSFVVADVAERLNRRHISLDIGD